MWTLIAAVLGIVITLIYVVIRFVQRRNHTTQRTSPNQVFSGFETHAIILINENVTSMEIVVNTLVRVIGISRNQATKLMLRVHSEGIAIVWTGSRNDAEQHWQEMKEVGLRCFVTELV